MQRAILILPEFENNHLIEEVRKKFDPLYGLVPPHITLVFPFESEIRTSTLKQHVRAALAGVRPFPIQLKGITATPDQYLFLNIKKGNDDIIELHDRLYSGMLGGFLSRRNHYAPHLTIGRYRDEAGLQAALDATESFEACFDAAVTSVVSEIIGDNGDSTIEFIVSLS